MSLPRYEYGENDGRLVICLPSDLKAKFVDVLHREGKSPSLVVRNFVKDFLKGRIPRKEKGK